MTAGIAAVAGPVLTVLGVMIMGVGKVVGVLGFLLSPMGLVVAAIIGLVAAFASKVQSLLRALRRFRGRSYQSGIFPG